MKLQIFVWKKLLPKITISELIFYITKLTFCQQGTIIINFLWQRYGIELKDVLYLCKCDRLGINFIKITVFKPNIRINPIEDGV